MKKIVQIDLPIGLGVRGEGEVLSALLPGNSSVQPLLVDIAAFPVELSFLCRKIGPDTGIEVPGATLPVGTRLEASLGRRGHMARVDGFRVLGRVLINTRRPVADPLSPAIHGDPDVEL